MSESVHTLLRKLGWQQYGEAMYSDAKTTAQVVMD